MNIYHFKYNNINASSNIVFPYFFNKAFFCKGARKNHLLKRNCYRCPAKSPIPSVSKNDLVSIGDIIETQFGYHIIKVANHTFEETISFDDAKEKIKNYLFVQNKQIAFAEYIKELRDNATIENL